MRAKIAAVAAVLAASVWMPASAQTGDVAVTDAWARATPGAAQAAAAYVSLESRAGDRLVGISTPAAQQADLHSMTMDNGVMKMRQVDGIDLPAGQAVTLKPGGYHIMLTGLTRPLTQGQSFPMTLKFAKAGAREVTVAVQGVGAMGPAGQTGGGATMPGMAEPMHH